MRHALKYFAYFAAAFLILFIVAYWVEDGCDIDTGFVPSYERREELDALFEKAKGRGITPDEAERLDWLMQDERRQSDQQFYEWQENKRK